MADIREPVNQSASQPSSSETVDMSSKYKQVKKVQLFLQLKALKTLGENLQTEEDGKTFLERVRRVPNITSAIKQLIDDIERANPDEEHDSESLKILQKLNAKINSQANAVREELGTKRYHTSRKSKQKHLPHLSLPTFSGELEDWPAFKNSYEKMIHNNEDLSVQDKIKYLIGCVRGDAVPLTQGVSPIGSNYQYLWQSLDRKFYNKRIMADSYMKELISMEPQSEHSLSTLNSFLENFHSKVKAVDSLFIPDLADYLLFYLAYSKLPAETKTLFDETHRPSRFYNYNDLVDFVESEKMKYSRVNKKPKKKQLTLVNTNELFVSQATFCILCPDGKHPLNTCPKFRRMSQARRWLVVKHHRRCVNCLKYHGKRSCMSRATCTTCNRKHHHLLHQEIQNESPQRESQLESEQMDSVRTTSSSRANASRAVSKPASGPILRPAPKSASGPALRPNTGAGSGSALRSASGAGSGSALRSASGAGSGFGSGFASAFAARPASGAGSGFPPGFAARPASGAGSGFPPGLDSRPASGAGSGFPPGFAARPASGAALGSTSRPASGGGFGFATGFAARPASGTASGLACGLNLRPAPGLASELALRPAYGFASELALRPVYGFPCGFASEKTKENNLAIEESQKEELLQPEYFKTLPEIQYAEELPQLENPEAFPRLENAEAFPRLEYAEAFPRLENAEAFLQLENAEALPQIENVEGWLQLENGEEWPQLENPDGWLQLEDDEGWHTQIGNNEGWARVLNPEEWPHLQSSADWHQPPEPPANNDSQASSSEGRSRQSLLGHLIDASCLTNYAFSPDKTNFYFNLENITLQRKKKKKEGTEETDDDDSAPTDFIVRKLSIEVKKL